MSHRNSLRHGAAAGCLAAAASLLAVAGCASGGGASGPADPEQRFYEARCGVCHVPFHKSVFRADQWPAIVENFAPRAGLSRSQRERIVRYLTSPDAPVAAAR
jgi:hypothetical protein